MEIHIGQEIHKVYKQKRFGHSELAAILSTSRQNLTALFKRESIDTKQLLVISKALDFDFFKLYTERMAFETGLASAMSTIDPLVECQKERDTLSEKYKLQTENASNQQKYIKMLEEKLSFVEKARQA